MFSRQGNSIPFAFASLRRDPDLFTFRNVCSSSIKIFQNDKRGECTFFTKDFQLDCLFVELLIGCLQSIFTYLLAEHSVGKPMSETTSIFRTFFLRSFLLHQCRIGSLLFR